MAVELTMTFKDWTYKTLQYAYAEVAELKAPAPKAVHKPHLNHGPEQAPLPIPAGGAQFDAYRAQVLPQLRKLTHERQRETEERIKRWINLFAGEKIRREAAELKVSTCGGPGAEH